MNYLTDIYSFAILVAVIVAAIAFAVAVYYFVNEKKFEQLRKWSSVVVNSLEQSMKLMSGPRKYELAMIALKGFRDSIHAKATDEELGILIDGAVNVMKSVAQATPGTLDDDLVNSLTEGLTPNNPK